MEKKKMEKKKDEVEEKLRKLFWGGLHSTSSASAISAIKEIFKQKIKESLVEAEGEWPHRHYMHSLYEKVFRNNGLIE